ncbi:GAF domain-containing protein [Bradyrhizobium sp.]|uniref:GAF domain-containing protein n=1 Tax=Bradyrhizobium sp. TaxID=376 RepID=UPI003C78823D
MTALPPDVVAELKRENARLRAELRAAGDRQNASAEILRTIGGASGDAELSLQQIAETTKRLFEASSVSIFVADGDKWGRIIHDGASSKRIGAEVPVAQLRIGGHSLPGTAFGENRQIHLPDIDNVDPAIADWPGLRPARAAGTRAISGTPLRRAGQTVGVLIVHRDRPVPFTEDELALLQSFADQAAIATENARLFNETKEALERQTATADILRVIASSPSDVQPVFEAIAISSNRLIGGFSTAVMRFVGDELHLAAFTPTNPKADEALKASFPRPLAEFPLFMLVRHGETQQFTDTESEGVPPLLRDLARLRGYRSMLFTPLMNSGKPIGMISVTRKEPATFAAHHVQLVRTFADQAVIAIENARLFDEVQAKTRDLSEALTYQTGSGNILKVIASSPTNVGPVLEAIVENACKLCDADDAVVHLREGDDLQYAAHHGPIPVGLQRRPINRNFIAGRSVADRVTIHLHDLLSAEGVEFPEAQEMSRRHGSRTFLCVPLLRETESIGTIMLRRTEVNPFSSKQIALLQTFADQAVIAIGNVRLFDEVQARTRELSQSLDELRTAQDRLVQTEKLASLGQLTAGIAHEIKNPLNFVNNFSALSAELTDELNDVLKSATLAGNIREEVDELTGMLKDNLEKVVQHGKRADSIVKNMLLHSREGSGEHRPADINALLDESLNLAYHGARAEKSQFNVTLRRDFDPNAGMIEVFPQEITRVLLNLISNGFYAVTKRKAENGTGFEPSVIASTRDRGEHVEIRIRDNGTGIPAEVKEKMFNPFFTTKPAGEGTGLGLSMSHDIIVKQHGGTIDVDTEPGQFTEFRIVLPRTSNPSNKPRG